MKLFTLFTRFSPAVSLSVLLAGTIAAPAQLPTGSKAFGNAAGMNAAMLLLFGSNTNFIAKSEIHVLDKNQHETTSMQIGYSMLAGQNRMDVNLALAKSTEMSPEFAATLKQIGMDQMSTVFRVDTKEIITIYPTLRAYAITPMPKDEIDAAAMKYKMDKTKAGKETVDGHPCDKDNVTFTDATGAKQHVVAWFANDLKDFPVKVQIPSDDVTLVMKFKDVKLGRPELNEFEPPAGFAKYDDVGTLTSDAVAKKMGVSASK